MGKIFFGLKKGQGLEKRVPHPLQDFPGVSPGKAGGEGGEGGTSAEKVMGSSWEQMNKNP